MTVYDFVVAVRKTPTEGAIINDRAAQFCHRGKTMDLIDQLTGELLLTVNDKDQVTYVQDVTWLTSEYKVPKTNEILSEYTKYLPDMDITIIFCDTWVMIDGQMEFAQGDITGYYHGEPSPELTKMYRDTYVRK